MVFYTGKIVIAMNNPTVVILTDRNDLDDQLFATFSASVQLLRQSPKQAGDREQIKELLKVNSGGVIFTTIQKFQPEDGSNVYDTLSERHNIIVIVIADEAHRSQYGFAAKEVDVKNDAGDVTGKRTVYGFAKYLRNALPNATYLGFTGTPIEKTMSTPQRCLAIMLIFTTSPKPLKMGQRCGFSMNHGLPKWRLVTKAKN